MTLRGRGKMSDKLEFSNNLFTIKDLYLPGMVSIRTHLVDKKFQKIIKDVFKINVPNKLQFTSNKNLYLAWMSPNELLLFSGYEKGTYFLTLSKGSQSNTFKVIKK